jgi:hypothetical protein
MFEKVEAIRFDRMMGTGKTKPLLLVCERADGTEVEVICKFSEGCSIGGLIREAIATMLACDLGLPVPPPYLVQLSPEFIDAIPLPAIAASLRKGDSFGFGSTRLPDGFAQWIPPQGSMSENLEQQALDIFAFDCWLTNTDRRISNPNVLSNGKTFAIFDHELALSHDLILFWKEPWQVSSLTGTSPPIDHIFLSHLQSMSMGNLDSLGARITALTDTRIAAYAQALPPTWAAEIGIVLSIKSFIMSLRDNIAPAIVELKRAMS